MCRVNVCCCCVPLRIGCMIIACVELVLALLYIWMITGYQGRPGSAGYVVPLLIEILVWGLLLFGAIANNETAVLVHLIILAIVLVMNGIILIIYISGLVVVCTGYGWTGYWCTVFILTGLIFLVLIALKIYFFIVILSFYQQLKGGGLPYPV